MGFASESQGKMAVAGSGALGFGAMGLTAFYGEALSDEAACDVLKACYEGGCRHFDTAEVYKSGENYNERVVGKFLKTVERESYTVATKYMPSLWSEDCSDFEKVRASLVASLERLGLDYVDLYYAHRVMSLEMALNFAECGKKFIKEGLVKRIGYSEITGDWLKKCHAVTPVACVQQEWSLITRSLEDELVPVCRDLGITIVAYSPLGRNLLTGVVTEPPNDWRKNHPRYEPENLKKNIDMVKQVKALADTKGCTPAQLSLAWLFSKAKDLGVSVIPIPGTTKITNLNSNLAATDITIEPSDMTLLENLASQVAGQRGNEDYMKRAFEAHLTSS